MPEPLRVGAVLLRQNDQGAVKPWRSMTLETIAPVSDDPIVSVQEQTG